MSVDILIFDPAAVSDADFPAWWEEQSEWSEDHSDPNPAVTTSELQAAAMRSPSSAVCAVCWLYTSATVFIYFVLLV